MGTGLDFPLGDDPISAVIGTILLVIFLPILIAFGLEFLALLVVLPIAVVGRVFFGRHWTIEARRGFLPVWEQKSGTWTESREQILAVASRIERGDLPPTTLRPDA